MPDPTIKISGLSKHFGPKTALAGVDISLQAGEFLTVFGPNGSGKTTMMRIIASLSRPSTGSVELFGKNIRRASAHVRQRIGFVTHRSLLYSSLSGFQNVHFFARMFGVDNPADRAREILSVMGLEHRMDDEVFTYSRGLEQRCAIARALVHHPDILLLDEPFSGLDPDASARLQNLLVDPEGKSRTVILTSHDLAHGVRQADRVAILTRGRIGFTAPVEQIEAGAMPDIYREHTRGNRG
jgi:heme exporter protein A